MPPSACNGLVRVAVDVSSDGGAEWSRHASVVDTGCTTSLVELALVRRLGLLHSVRDSNESLLTIQGHTLTTSGCVDVMMRRLDGHVYLPHICATLVVVEDLAALNTDILLGADIAAKTGGVNIAYETPGGRLSSVVFGTRLAVTGAGVASSSKLSRHMSVKENDDTVTLEMTDDPHKETTPVRPCLDYRQLNQRLLSHPGYDTSSCDETMREWRMRSSDGVMLDLRKASLQIHVAPNLYRYQAVLWRGKLYAMTRMGFGLNVAPNIMDMVVKWATRDLSGVDNYVDDLYVERAAMPATTEQLRRYGLDMKPAVEMPQARVLGLQLSSEDGVLQWKRRQDSDLSVPTNPTRRNIVSWCGKLVGHYPVCGWLRPACNWLKRQLGSDAPWDAVLPESIVRLCRELLARLQAADPVQGVWSVTLDESTEWHVWCDASGIALGAVVQVNGSVIEDRSWLRAAKDARHINIVELDAVIKGLNLATKWPVKRVTIHTAGPEAASADRCGRRAIFKGGVGVLPQNNFGI